MAACSPLSTPQVPPAQKAGKLTGVLPKDCVAHELEEALGVEAGPVDGDSVLGRDVGAEGKQGCEHYGSLCPWQPRTDHCGGWGGVRLLCGGDKRVTARGFLEGTQGIR